MSKNYRDVEVKPGIFVLTPHKDHDNIWAEGSRHPEYNTQSVNAHMKDFECGYLGPQNELEYIKEVEGSYDVIKDFEVGYLGPQVDPIVEMVRQDLLDRSRVGLKKYGTTLARKDLNLLQFLNHAYEECLDQANYLKRAIVELDSPGAQ